MEMALIPGACLKNDLGWKGSLKVLVRLPCHVEGNLQLSQVVQRHVQAEFEVLHHLSGGVLVFYHLHC